MRRTMGIIACIFAFAVPVVLVTIGANRDEPRTTVRAIAGPQTPPPTAPTTTVPEPVTEPPTTLAPEPEPAPVLCPGAPHPEQACLAPNHEATSPSAGTRQAASEASSGGAGGDLASIRQCESSSNYSYNDGQFQGGYNYMPSTWQSAQATAGIPPDQRTATADQSSPATQDSVTASYIAAGNRGAWPHC